MGTADLKHPSHLMDGQLTGESHTAKLKLGTGSQGKCPEDLQWWAHTLHPPQLQGYTDERQPVGPGMGLGVSGIHSTLCLELNHTTCSARPQGGPGIGDFRAQGNTAGVQ